MMKGRMRLATAVIVVLVLGTAFALAVPRLPERTASVPTARVVQGPLKLTVHASGELRAGRTVTLVTPPVGGMLRIVHMVPTGTLVKAGDVVVEFDPADQQYALEQAKSEMDEAEQGILKMKADAAVQRAQDEEALLNARFEVRRAELDATRNEFISAVDARKNDLTLEEARRRLAQLEEDLKSRAVTSQASLAVSEERRNKAMLAMQRAQQIIDSLELKAPLDGLVAVKDNQEASGGMMYFGMQLPEYREGDSIWPGRPVVDVIEAGRMELRAKINENDRSNLVEGQEAAVMVDTLPGDRFTARVGALAGLATRASFFEAASITRQFDVTFQFVTPDPRLKAGSSAQVVIDGTEIADAIHVPRQAVFERNGKNHVFLKVGDRFEQREVTIVQATESRLVIEGLDPGAEIALVDPAAATTSAPGQRPHPCPAEAHDETGPHLRLDIGLPPGPPARRREPARSHPALAADDARNDLRGGGGGGDAVDRRRRAAGGHGVHRAARRSQPHRGSARGTRQSGAPADPQALGRPELPGLPDDPRQPRRDHRVHGTQALHAEQAPAAPPGRRTSGLRREPLATPRSRISRSSAAVSSTKTRTPRQRRLPCSAKGPRPRSLASTTRSAST
jgi:HlyD family secretion protein